MIRFLSRSAPFSRVFLPNFHTPNYILQVHCKMQTSPLKRYIPNKHQLYKVRGTWVNGVFPYFFEGALAIPSLRGPAHLTIFAIEVLVFINFWERSTDADGTTDVDTDRDGEGGSDGAKVTRSSFERVTLEARKRDDGSDGWCVFVCFFRLHKRQATETAVLFQ